jgi:hypothetical protein
MRVNKNTISEKRGQHMGSLMTLSIVGGFITVALALWLVMSNYILTHDYGTYYSTMLVYADMNEKPIDGGSQNTNRKT